MERVSEVRSSLAFSVAADLLALTRVLNVFRRQGLKLEFMAVRPGEDPDVWRVTAEVEGEVSIDFVARSLEKQLPVLSVSVATFADATTA